MEKELIEDQKLFTKKWKVLNGVNANRAK